MATNSHPEPSTSGDWVCLISSDKFRFVLPKSMALLSGTLKDTLNESEDRGNFVEAQTNEVNVQYRGIVVARVVEYLAYKAQYLEVPTKDVLEDYTERIEPELALEVLMAADYLDC